MIWEGELRNTTLANQNQQKTALLLCYFLQKNFWITARQKIEKLGGKVRQAEEG